jgi:putative ABC transport system permease protein
MFSTILKRSFSRQRRRKSLAALAVIAGMAVATAMLTVRVNLGDDLNAELTHIGANLVVTPASDSLPVELNGVDLRPAGSGALLPEGDVALARTIFWTNNIVAIAPELDTQATLDGRAVTVAGTYFDRTVPRVGGGAGFPAGMRKLESGWAIQGHWPRDDGDEVLAGVILARRLHLAPGGRVTLHEGPRREAAVIAGVLASGGAEDREIVAPLRLAQALANRPGQIRRILVAAITKPEDTFARENPAAMTPAEQERWMCSPYALTIAHQLQQAIPHSSATVIRPVAASEGAILAQLRLLLWFITLLALAASALAIAGAMTAAVLERRGEIALMKAVGAQDRAIGALFLSEAALLGVGGGAIGYVAGELLAAVIARHVLGHAVAWKPALAPLILLLGAAVTLAGSLQPLRRAMRIEPATALRSEG